MELKDHMHPDVKHASSSEMDLACDLCGHEFTAEGSCDSDDPDVGWVGGWSTSVNLPEVERHTAFGIVYQCAGERLLDPDDAARIAMAGGIGAVVDCRAEIDDDVIVELFRERAEADAEAAAVDAYEDRMADRDDW